MAVSSGNNVIRMTSDDDKYGDNSMGRLKFKGARLVAGSGATGTAQIKVNDTNGSVLCSMSAVQATADECSICFTCDSGMVHLDLTGSGAEVYLYLE